MLIEMPCQAGMVNEDVIVDICKQNDMADKESPFRLIATLQNERSWTWKFETEEERTKAIENFRQKYLQSKRHWTDTFREIQL